MNNAPWPLGSLLKYCRLIAKHWSKEADSLPQDEAVQAFADLPHTLEPKALIAFCPPEHGVVFNRVHGAWS